MSYRKIDLGGDPEDLEHVTIRVVLAHRIQ